MTLDVVKGLVLLEGSFPVDHLNPGLKHLVHYGRQTGKMGLMDWFSMFSFERNNKRVKGMVKHTGRPLASLANNVETDIQTRIEMWSEKKSSDFECPQPVRLTVRLHYYDFSDRERNDMQSMGVTSCRGVKVFKVAKILGVHFRSGEWGCRRCGSVITTIYQRVSRYCIVNAFFMVEGETCASVTWLTVPTHPYSPFKLVVKVKLFTREQQRLYPSVIVVNRIEPCTVGVIPYSDGVHFYMLRDKGIDRTV